MNHIIVSDVARFLLLIFFPSFFNKIFLIQKNDNLLVLNSGML